MLDKAYFLKELLAILYCKYLIIFTLLQAFGIYTKACKIFYKGRRTSCYFRPFGFRPNDFQIIWPSNLSALSVSDEGYSRNVSDEGYSRNASC